jgi:glutaminyl-peptide cyclotransferase
MAFTQNRKPIISSFFLLFLLNFLLGGCLKNKQISKESMCFDGNQAYQDVIYQQELGPRIPGSMAHDRIVTWLTQELERNQWQVELQYGWVNGKNVENLIASRAGEWEYLLLGAHYDTRIHADQDVDVESRKEPVPGANDGASGVAVLIELSRCLPEDLSRPVKLAFFDAEDSGGIDDWDWIMGSRYFVQVYQPLPSEVVIVDMVGDSDLQIYYEYNSNAEMLGQIWEQARNLGYEMYFIPEYRHSMLDDHTPFVEQGIPAVDLIDFNYTYWHTTEDTFDKVSPESLEIVGSTMLSWILAQDQPEERNWDWDSDE